MSPKTLRAALAPLAAVALLAACTGKDVIADEPAPVGDDAPENGEAEASQPPARETRRERRAREAREKEAARAVAETAVAPPKDPYPSTYAPYAAEPVVIVNATVLTGTGRRIDNGVVAIADGVIAAVGDADARRPAGARIIDAKGKWVTPGVIDIHSHLGDYPSPSTASTSDGNEATAPNTAQVWAEHSVWPQDPGFTRALAGGVTTLQILPGSANLFGGRSAILKNVPGRTVQEMKFPGARYGLKMACGENPKRVYGDKGGPSTRMGNVAGFRAGWIEADAYRRNWKTYTDDFAKWSGNGGEGKEGAEKPPEAPARDLKLETLALALDGEITVNIHCYRADEMAQMLDMAKEFGFRVATFHHAVEAYKVADILAQNGVCAAVWADWWGFKLEAYDSVRENAALVAAQDGGCAIIHSDDAEGIQRLNQEAAKAMADGRRIGLDIKPETAISWITFNAAKAMGIEDRTGSIQPGKMGDVVIWSGNPFSVYAKAERVFIDGALMYDATDPSRSPRTDFEIGQQGAGFTGGSGQ